MSEKYIQVNESWLKTLVKYAKQAEKYPDEKLSASILIGHALSAKTVLKYGKKIDPIVDEWGKDI